VNIKKYSTYCSTFVRAPGCLDIQVKVSWSPNRNNVTTVAAALKTKMTAASNQHI
jgi:hypothetical protein